MIPRDYQDKYSDVALEILKKFFLVYFAWEERTGKTLTAILVVEKSAAESALVVTKKGKPLKGWVDTLKAYNHKKKYEVINYHSAHKIEGNFDIIILDEAHNYISSFPKPGLIWKQMGKITKGKPIIYLSATPHAQGPQMLYHQFALSSWSPWKKFTNFYRWFNTYGKPYTLKIGGRDINQYDRCHKDDIMKCVNHLFLSKTRRQLGFHHEPQDELHYINLDDTTKKQYNTIVEDEMVELPDMLLICDTKSKMRFSLHQLEGGTMKQDEKYIILENNEKIDYILTHWGDDDSVVIMYNYVAEYDKLKKYFKKALLLQATKNAEGVELASYEHLIVYSQDFSTARHTQRRARQASKDRDRPILVHFLLVEGGLSDQVYRTVSKNKKNYVDSVFERTKL